MLSRLRGWLTGAELRRLVRFGAAACWSLQWLCFHFLLPLVGEPIAYVCGMVVYTACNYIYNKCVTFRQS